MKILKAGGKLHWIKNLYLRTKNGAGCCDIYNVDSYLAPKILATLKQFRPKTEWCMPYGFASSEEWGATVDEMIWAFEQVIADNDSIEDNEKIQRGLELFGKYYRNLWY